MDIKQLKYFKTIVDEGGISKAAQVLHMAQPPLSQQLQRLEKELGTTLIKRYTQQWELTETGKILYTHAVQMLQESKIIKQEIQEMEEGLRGNLSIGIAYTCVSYLFEHLHKFREAYPNIFIKVWQGDSSYLEELLIEQKIEFSLMLLPQTLENYRVTCLLEEPFVAVVPSIWKERFPNKTVNLKDIIDYPFLMLGPMKGYSLYENMLSNFHKHQFSPNIVMECKDISTILSLVASGLGISIVPKSGIQAIFNHNIEVLEIENFQFYIEPAIVSLKKNSLTKAARYFLNQFTAK
ncbi:MULTISPECIES: LysR family transcriptional regulator [Priestia]|uniref:LysR family transcriptional regulator n=1 Tax=Priestia TaxID=2800373 RepID=UPI0016434EA1|nr:MULTISPECIES: LysR family transcriptional regulator [Priestia]MBK0009636.1 LysR family transcriptional regulator [Bacillus sp. S35]MBU8756941.1 LysR family transcriptional regulator [Priestia megaterium]MBZ6488446.1 LysR family transcriptional regulator [Priestia aryabhattai]MDH3130159.1 LysR family transcriptional regulator [Priestia aryabhattai]